MLALISALEQALFYLEYSGTHPLCPPPTLAWQPCTLGPGLLTVQVSAFWGILHDRHNSYWLHRPLDCSHLGPY